MNSILIFLVFQVPHFEEKNIPMGNLQMSFLLVKAGQTGLCFVVLL